MISRVGRQMAQSELFTVIYIVFEKMDFKYTLQCLNLCSSTKKEVGINSNSLYCNVIHDVIN